MKKMRKTVYLLLACTLVGVVSLSGCGKKDEKDSTSKETIQETEEEVKEKKYLKMETSISYSSGDTKNWTYGNQRKEFPNNEACYVRIGTTAITTGLFGKGSGDSITVTYRFTGTEYCPVTVSDGIATEVENDDSNVTEFTHKVTAAKEKKASEDIMIFRYSPDGADNVVLEIIYDDQVNDRFDELNTIYFDKVTDEENQVH